MLQLQASGKRFFSTPGSWAIGIMRPFNWVPELIFCKHVPLCACLYVDLGKTNHVGWQIFSESTACPAPPEALWMCPVLLPRDSRGGGTGKVTGCWEKCSFTSGNDERPFFVHCPRVLLFRNCSWIKSMMLTCTDFFSFWAAPRHMEFLGQGSDPRHRGPRLQPWQRPLCRARD